MRNLQASIADLGAVVIAADNKGIIEFISRKSYCLMLSLNFTSKEKGSDLLSNSVLVTWYWKG